MQNYWSYPNVVLNRRRKFAVFFQKFDFFSLKKIQKKIYCEIKKAFFVVRFSGNTLLAEFGWNYKTPSEIFVMGEWTSFDRFHSLRQVDSGLTTVCPVLPGRYYYRYFQDDDWNWSFDVDLIGYKKNVYHQKNISFRDLEKEKYIKRKTSLLDILSHLNVKDLNPIPEKRVWFYPYKGIPYLPPVYYSLVPSINPYTRNFVKTGIYHHEITLSFFVYLNHIFIFESTSFGRKNKYLGNDFPCVWVRSKDKIIKNLTPGVSFAPKLEFTTFFFSCIN